LMEHTHRPHLPKLVALWQCSQTLFRVEDVGVQLIQDSYHTYLVV
jgi:hypothetical protein